MVNLGPTEPYEPKPGDIGLTVIDGWGGRGIRTAQAAMGCGWKAKQHAFVWVGAAETFERTAAGAVKVTHSGATDLIVEAMPGGAVLTPMWHDLAQTDYLRCPDQYRTAVAAAAMTLVGTPYSPPDYGAIALHHLHIPAPWLRAYIANTGHMICSQLADYAAQDGGWNLFDDGRWPGYVPPCDLGRLYARQVHA